MPSIAEFINQARTYLNVRWKHQGRSRDGGVDCVGIFYCVSVDLGMAPTDVRNYGHRPGSRRMIAEALLYCEEIHVEQRRIGDFLLVTTGGEEPQHMVLITGTDSVLHASAKHRKVVEHRLDDELRRGICKVFRSKVLHG